MKRKKLIAFAVTVTIFATSVLVLNKMSDNNSEEIIYSTENYRITNLSDSKPYAIFGEDTPMLMTKCEEEGTHQLTVDGFGADRMALKLVLDTKTGLVEVSDANGNIVSSKTLNEQEMARWFGVDPLAEKYSSLSPYAYCNNNPVKYIDPNGMYFTDSMEEMINMIMGNVNSMYSSYEQREQRLLGKLGGDISDRKRNRLMNRLSNVNSNMMELDNMKFEIGLMRESSQGYDFLINNSRNTSEFEVASLEFKDGLVSIMLPSKSMGLFAHELKHAYQFETGNLSIQKTISDVSFYDKSDEVEAYNRGAMLGGNKYGINNLPRGYNRLPNGPLNANSNPKLVRLMGQANFTDYIRNNAKMQFRYGGVTYY